MTAILILAAIPLAALTLALLLNAHGSEIAKGILPEADLLRRETDPYVVDRTTCGATRGALTCGRFPGHDGPHADPYTGRGDWPVKWLDAEPPFGGAA